MTQNEQRDCVLVACAVFVSTLLALALSPISPLALVLVGAALHLVTVKGHVTRGLVGGAILAAIVAVVVAPIGSAIGLLVGFGAAHAAHVAQLTRRSQPGGEREPAGPDKIAVAPVIPGDHATTREG